METGAKRRMTVSVTRLHAGDASFDREFWGAIPPGSRVAALWEMVEEWADWRGIDRDELRLQRSAGRVERHGR
jgi:hypothetical protein